MRPAPKYLTAEELPGKKVHPHLPSPLHSRIASIAKAEKRNVTRQMIVLLEEAVKAREARN